MEINQNQGKLIEIPNKDIDQSSNRNIFDFTYTNAPPKAKIPFLSRKIPWKNLPDRKIISNTPDLQLCDNGISTGKYSVITFFPKNLFEQFSKVANIYFLVIGIMQTIPAISVSNGRPDTFLPLFFIVLVTMIKDMFEDIKRHKADKEENTKACTYYNVEHGKLMEKKWRELHVKKDQFFPADCLLIACSNPKGLCYIETKNLDGETNLKHRLMPKGLKAFNIMPESPEEVDCSQQIVFSYEKPNPYLYNFNGNLTITEDQKIPLDNNNFILRGCSLKNTDWVYALIGYTGHDTKIMLNSVKARVKRSRLETLMSYQIVYVFFFQIGICLFSAIYYTSWFESNKNHLPYLSISNTSSEWNSGYNFITRFGNWIIIFSNFVPISLIVTLEMVKFFQGMLMSRDPHLLHKPTKIPISVQSSNLNEELGQIEYIFSDKTGTLTCNYMEFRKLVVNGIPYGYDASLDNIDSFPKVTNVNFRDTTFINIINDSNHKEHAYLANYLKVLSICHTIMVETKNNKIEYNASSPDELALVNFSCFCGSEFKGTDEENNMIVSFKGQDSKFTVLQVLEFTSKRKRNSVIVKDQQGQIFLYCKGADTMIKERLSQNSRNGEELKKTLDELEKFGDEGLRTLLISERKLSQDQYDQWLKQYLEAQMATEARDEKIEAAQELIEVDLELVGATAIEDKLQDDVGDTIEMLKRAGIKVWVLTGDKKETAINIGFSCNLLNKEIEKIIVEGETFEEVKSSLENGINELMDLQSKQKARFALVITGQALIFAMKDTLPDKIMQIANHCEAVICCRVSPKQKADVVMLVRKTKPTVCTLAIGDGANDVNMITAAHVGVGIRGVEGQQAARASDYAIGEFKFLKRLVLVHGRESYRKNSNLILYNFFKNVLLVLPIFWVGFNMVFSGQRLYDSWLYAFFNIFYSSWPIIIYCLFDQEYTDKELLAYPDLYTPGIKNERFNAKRFWIWFFNAAYQAVLIGYISLYSMEWNSPNVGGRLFDLWSSGAMMLGACVVVVNLKIIVISNIDSWANTVIIILSMGVYVLCFFILSLLQLSDVYEIFDDIWYVAFFYLGNLLIIATTTYFDLAIWRIFVLKRNDSFSQKISLEQIKLYQELDSGPIGSNSKVMAISNEGKSNQIVPVNPIEFQRIIPYFPKFNFKNFLNQQALHQFLIQDLHLVLKKAPKMHIYISKINSLFIILFFVMIVIGCDLEQYRKIVQY